MSAIVDVLKARRQLLLNRAEQIQGDLYESIHGTAKEESAAHDELAALRIRIHEAGDAIAIMENIRVLSEQLTECLIAHGYSANIFSEGITEGEFEDLAPILNQFLQEIGLSGRIVLIWDEYRNGFLSGGYVLNYVERSVDELASLVASIVPPEPYVDDLADGFVAGLYQIKEGWKPLKPAHFCDVGYEHNVAFHVRGDGSNEVACDEDDECEADGEEDDEDSIPLEHEIVLYKAPASAWKVLFQTLGFHQAQSTDISLRQRIAEARRQLTTILYGHFHYYGGPVRAWDVLFHVLRDNIESETVLESIRQEIRLAYNEVSPAEMKVQAISVPKDELRDMQKILDIKNGYYEDAGADDVIETYTADFGDGIQADIKIYNGNTPYLVAVIFDHGSEVYALEAAGLQLLGEYDFEVNGVIYRAVVKVV